MNYKLALICALICTQTTFSSSNEHHLVNQQNFATLLTLCLRTCYNVDEAGTQRILAKLTPYEPVCEQHQLVEQFIAMTLTSARSEGNTAPVHPEDALAADPTRHELLFENDTVRVLWITLEAGDTCPAHTHQWPSINLVMERTSFTTYNTDGTTQEDVLDTGVHYFPADTAPLAYKNSSTTNFACLSFEIK